MTKFDFKGFIQKFIIAENTDQMKKFSKFFEDRILNTVKVQVSDKPIKYAQEKTSNYLAFILSLYDISKTEKFNTAYKRVQNKLNTPHGPPSGPPTLRQGGTNAITINVDVLNFIELLKSHLDERVL